MSRKEWFKSLKKKSAPVPRTTEELTKIYSRLASDAGQAQYQVHVYTHQLEELNRAMRDVNNEASERSKLDSVAKKEETQTETKGA